VATIAGFLMTDDSFRLGVDDLLGRMIDLRKELQDTDLESSPRKLNRADECLLLKQLTVCSLFCCSCALRCGTTVLQRECVLHM
jgi:hypothetical protein